MLQDGTECKGPGLLYFYPFAAFIVDIIMAYVFQYPRSQILLPLQTRDLTGDEYTSFFKIHHRLIGPSVVRISISVFCIQRQGPYLGPRHIPKTGRSVFNISLRLFMIFLFSLGSPGPLDSIMPSGATSFNGQLCQNPRALLYHRIQVHFRLLNMCFYIRNS